MLINVKNFGIYGRILGDSLIVELSDGDRILELLEFLNNKISQLEEELPPLMESGKPLVKIIINGIDANLNTPLQDGDNLSLFPVIGGG